MDRSVVQRRRGDEDGTGADRAGVGHSTVASSRTSTVVESGQTSTVEIGPTSTGRNRGILAAQRRLGNRAVGRFLEGRANGAVGGGSRDGGLEGGETVRPASTTETGPVDTGPAKMGPTETGSIDTTAVAEPNVPETSKADRDVPSNSFPALGAGRRLPSSTRSTFEPTFGSALDAVRLHTGGFGVAAARAMDVPAFAVGRDVVVRPERYAPHSSAGQSLLAHELAHVIQQGRSAGRSVGRVAAERHADTTARSAVRGGTPVSPVATDVRVAPQGYTGTHALAPEDLFELLKSWRGHTATSGAGRVDWSRLSMGVDSSSQMLGRGNSTTAIVTISDADGNLIATGAGISDGTRHAELNAVLDIRNNLKSDGLRTQLRGAHVMVVVDQEVCGTCQRMLTRLVDRNDMAGVRAYTFSREKLVGSGQASPKTSMHGITRDYVRTPGPLRKQVDFTHANPDVASSGSAGNRARSETRPRQGELFEPYRGQQAASQTTDRRGATRTESGTERSRTGAGLGGGPRQQTLFEHVRRMSNESGEPVSAPAATLSPAVRFVRFVSMVSDLATAVSAIEMLVTNMNLASALMSGEVAILTDLEESLLEKQTQVEALERQYDEYSSDLRAIEPSLAAIANTEDLDAIYETELDLRTVHSRLRSHQGWLEVVLLPRLTDAKRAIIEKRRGVDEAMELPEVHFALGLGGSTAPHAQVVAFRQDLIALTGILSRTIRTVERTVVQIERDREFLQTWEDWLADVYVQLIREVRDSARE